MFDYKQHFSRCEVVTAGVYGA